MSASSKTLNARRVISSILPIGVGRSVSKAGVVYFPNLYLFLNFSTRPVASTIFSEPVKNGWQALQMSIRISDLFDKTVKLFPQAQLTWHSTNSGWIPFFIIYPLRIDLASYTTAASEICETAAT